MNKGDIITLPNDGERMIPYYHRATMAYGDHIARYESVLPLVKDKTVLDIASGSGYGAKLLSGLAKKVYGVDISHDAIEYAKVNFSADNIDFIEGSGTQIPLQENSVDLILTFETLEHIEEANKFLEEIKRTLKNDGLLVLSTPNDDEFPKGNHFHVHEYSYDELVEFMKKHFKYVKAYYQATWLYTAVGTKDKVLDEFDDKIRVINAAPLEKNKVLYFMLLCSDVPITEDITPLGVISEHWSAKTTAFNNQKIDKYIKKTIKHFENILEAKDAQIAELNKTIHSYEKKTGRKSRKLVRKISNKFNGK